jgi:glycosyltransferase involved in cell wall biosynthesis
MADQTQIPPASDASSPALVSAIIPAFNGANRLAEAIQSVLDQSYPRVECIVVDDGSTDGSPEIAAGFGSKVRLIRQDNAGAAAARNRGAVEARGTLFAFLDQDDRWRPSRLERQLDTMAREHADAALCANVVLGDRAPQGRLVSMDPPEPTLESLLLWRGTVVSPGSSLLIRRGPFEEIGGFETATPMTCDWVLLTRLVGGRARLVYVDEPLVEYRWHSDNTTRDIAALERDLRRAYGMILAREGPRLRVSRRRAYGGMHRCLAAASTRLGHQARALAHGLRAGLYDPRSVRDVLGSRIRSLVAGPMD